MLTIAKGTSAEIELEVKRSRFLGFAARADSQEEARSVIQSQKSAYPDARHHCSAFIVRPRDSNPLMHSSDDGEPSGTAGTPMLNVLQHSGLENVVVVVTRYFGGTLLGTGGLVRAYSESTRLSLEAAKKVRIVSRSLFRVELDPTIGGRVEAEFRGAGHQIHEAVWSSHFTLTVAGEDKSELDRLLAEATHAPLSFQEVGTVSAERPLTA